MKRQYAYAVTLPDGREVKTKTSRKLSAPCGYACRWKGENNYRLAAIANENDSRFGHFEACPAREAA